MTESHIRNVIEAALLAAGKPLHAAELVDLFDDGAERPTLAAVQAALAGLAEEYSTRGIEIKETAAGFRIQVRAGLSNQISRLWPERPAKYSRALLETLAIIAYRQPITRAEIEAVRGVAVNPNIIKTVIERNWVHVVGHRDVPGRPELLSTTRDFLDYFGLKRLDELPPLAELKAIGEIKVQFDLPDPGPLALASDAAVEPGAAGENTDTAAGEVAIGEAANTAAGAGEVAIGEAANTATAAGEVTADEGANSATIAREVVGGDAANAEAVIGKVANAAASNTEAANSDADTNSAVASTAAAGDVEATTAAGEHGADEHAAEGAAADAPAHNAEDPKKATPSAGRGSGRKKKRGNSQATDSALHEAEEFAASVDADLAAADDDSSDEDELSAAGPDSSELVAGPRDIDD
jgi:segregation and condensation protein B